LAEAKGGRKEMESKWGDLPEDFKRCAEFHGHICPGLAIGYRASLTAMAFLKEKRAIDEELVAIVENDACGVDAVQVLTGCTFGKGNLIHKDYGKQVFTFIGRGSGRGVRVALRAGVIDPPKGEGHQPMERRDKMKRILSLPQGQLFSLKEVTIPPPPRAIIEPSISCDRCKEPTMKSKLREIEGERLCMDCIEALGLNL